MQVQLTQGFRYTLGDGAVWATVYARRPDATAANPQPRPAFVERIELMFSFAAKDAVESIKFDVLQAIVSSPQFSKLVLAYSSRSKRSNEYKRWKTILYSVLDGKQLTWALDSRKLQFKTPSRRKIVTSSDILSVPTEYTFGDVTVTLKPAQQAKWLLCFTPDAKDEYLQKLVTARMSKWSGQSSPADLGACPLSCSGFLC